MVDDTVKRIHDIALKIVLKNKKFVGYRKDLSKRIAIEEKQRKFVFPYPRPVEIYLKDLKEAGFKNLASYYKFVKIRYSDWLDFLRVKRLQAGILPEIGGKEPSPKEENDRDTLITLAAQQLFNDLKQNNPMADDHYFTTEWIYISATKPT